MRTTHSPGRARRNHVGDPRVSSHRRPKTAGDRHLRTDTFSGLFRRLLRAAPSFQAGEARQAQRPATQAARGARRVGDARGPRAAPLAARSPPRPRAGPRTGPTVREELPRGPAARAEPVARRRHFCTSSSPAEKQESAGTVSDGAPGPRREARGPPTSAARIALSRERRRAPRSPSRPPSRAPRPASPHSPRAPRTEKRASAARVGLGAREPGLPRARPAHLPGGRAAAPRARAPSSLREPGAWGTRAPPRALEATGEVRPPEKARCSPGV